MPLLTTIFSLLIVRKLMRLMGGLVLASVMWVVLLRFVSPVPGVQVVGASFSGGAVREWVSYDEMNVHVMKAAIVAQDETFLNHWGFDFRGTSVPMKAQQQHDKALMQGHVPDVKLPGQQTISQQVASQVFVGQGRGGIRTVFRGYFTLLIELFWTKKRILEVYLNSVPVADKTFGVQQASLKLYQQPVQKLSVQQAAELFARMPNPNARVSREAVLFGMQKLPEALFPVNGPNSDSLHTTEVTRGPTALDTTNIDEMLLPDDPPALRGYNK